MIGRLLDMFTDNSGRSSRRHSRRDCMVVQNIPCLIEFMEQRLVLSATTFPFQVTVQPDGRTDHVLLVSDVTNDTAGNGILNGAGKTTPTFTLTISRNGDTTPTHQFQVDLISNSQIIATTGLLAAGTSSMNLQLAVGTNGLPALPVGESDITVRFTRPSFPSANLATVTVRVNQDPSTQDQSFTVFEGSSLNNMDLGVSDPDADNFTIRINSTPVGGQLFRQDGSLIAAGQTLNLNTDVVRYTPNVGQTVSDSFSFSATDDVGGASAIRTASITLVTQPSGTPVLATSDDTGQDRDGDNTTDAEPAGLIIGGRAIDKVTSVTSALTFSIDAPGVDSVEFRAINVVTSTVTTGAGIQTGNTFSADLNLAPGTYDIIARSTVGLNPAIDSSALKLNIDNTNPATPVVVPQGAIDKGGGNFLTTDATPGFDLTAIEENALIIVERADHGSGTFNEISRQFPVSTNGIVTSFTDNSLTVGGSYTYRFKQIDIAGNDPPSIVTVVIDNVAPTITNLMVNGAAPQTNPLIDVTQPVFTFTVTDQRYAAFDNPLLVELVDQTGTVRDSTTLANPAGADGTFQQNVTLSPTTPLGTGQHLLRLRVTDPDLAALGTTASTTTSNPVSVTVTSADTQGAPGTPVFGRIYDLRTIGTDPGGTGGDVFLLDADGIPTTNEVNFYGSHVWQTAFDKTTQTVWVNFEHGLATGVNDTVSSEDGTRTFTIPIQNPATMQFDPATGQFKLFDYRSIFGDNAVLLSNTDPATDARGPHGNFFDFDSHVNPRIWVAHRNPAPSSPSSSPGNLPGNVGGDGRISYIEVRPGADGKHRVVTYDIASLAGVELTDMHAAFVDARGTVWFTSSKTSSLLEIDFDIEPNPADPNNTVTFSESPTIDSATARVKVHTMPPGMLTGEGVSGDHSAFHGHAQKVVVDDQTGEQYVWIASVGGKGQVALLRPGAGENGEDVWTTWDVPSTAGLTTQQSRVPFVEIDDNESPGDPTDDRIIFVAPVSGAEGAQGGVVGIVQILDPGLIPGDPTAAATATLKTYQIKGLTQAFAATNQPYLDREGGIYWIDRLSGVGRIDPGPATEISLNGDDGVAVSSRILLSDVRDSFFIDEERDSNGIPIETRVSPVIGFAALDKSEAFLNEGTQDGVNQYRVVGSNPIAVDDIPNGLMGARGQGVGPFRGAINAGNVLYGAHTTTDEFSATVFAETTRRQMAVVRTSDTLTAGAIVEGRKAFQVVRTKVDPTSQEQVGAVIMTFRNDGDILDQQVNLTNLVAQQIGVTPQSIAMNGDVSVVRDSSGNVYVVGKGDRLDLIAYRFDAELGTWNLVEFGDGLQILSAEPTAVLVTDPMTMQQHLAILATNSQGRLLLFEGATAPTDLTPIAQNVENTAAAAYGNLAVVQNSTGGFSVYAVNQQGGVVQYILNANLTRVSGPTLLNIASTQDGLGADLFTAEEIRVFQSVKVVEVNGVRHLFGNDGASRLVHMSQDMSGNWTAENVTKLTAPTAAGYFAFQQEFAARIYSEIAVVHDDSTGNLFIYGTNGGDLVEFNWDGTNWSAANLTNDMMRSTSPTGRVRVTANNVFGAPDAYLGLDGARHVMQINADGEVVEYVLHRDGTFATQNINLARGNDVLDLREFSQSPIIRLPGDPALYAQNGAASILDSNAVLDDATTDFTDKTITVRVVNFSAADVISFITTTGNSVLVDGFAIGTFITSVGQSKATVTLNATATRERVEKLLRQVTFSQTSVDPEKLGSRLIDESINDASGVELTNAVKALAVLSEGMLDSPIDGKILA